MPLYRRLRLCGKQGRTGPQGLSTEMEALRSQLETGRQYRHWTAGKHEQHGAEGTKAVSWSPVQMSGVGTTVGLLAGSWCHYQEGHRGQSEEDKLLGLVLPPAPPSPTASYWPNPDKCQLPRVLGNATLISLSVFKNFPLLDYDRLSSLKTRGF